MDPQPYFDCIPQENKEKLDWQLDKGHGGVQTHLGMIANCMDEWEGPVADALGLTKVNVADIRDKRISLGLKT